MDRIAKCHCGDLRVTCHGEPRKISMCCCFDCQRRTGSAFSVAVFYASEQMTVVAGAESVFERPSASGFPVAFHFCPRCGANLYWVPHRMANLVGVAIGAFADPDFPSPEQVVWTEEMQRWTPLPNGLPCFEQSPPPRGSC
jgi:hypothetical protein